MQANSLFIRLRYLECTIRLLAIMALLQVLVGCSLRGVGLSHGCVRPLTNTGVVVEKEVDGPLALAIVDAAILSLGYSKKSDLYYRSDIACPIKLELDEDWSVTIVEQQLADSNSEIIGSAQAGEVVERVRALIATAQLGTRVSTVTRIPVID